MPAIRTGHFGKWHLTNVGTAGAPNPDAYGFDDWVIFDGAGPEAPMRDTADNAVKFIAANKDRSFYVNVWLHESHLPHIPTDESMREHAALDPQQQVYAAVIGDGDKAVGKVLAALRAAGVERNTLVVFSSDNGPENTGTAKAMNKVGSEPGRGPYYSIGETGGLRGRKRSLFEGGVRTPFLVRWPGRTPAGRVNEKTVFSPAWICRRRSVPPPPACRSHAITAAMAKTCSPRSKASRSRAPSPSSGNGSA